MNHFLGIDPGHSGALAAIDELGKPVWIMPFKDMTEADLAEHMSTFRLLDNKFAMIEQVHSMPRQGVASSFTFGKQYGMLIGLLNGFKIRHEYVTPQKWQKEMGCRSGGDKNVTKAAAQRLFPELKITHATADALLLAEYCRRTLNQRGGK